MDGYKTTKLRNSVPTAKAPLCRFFFERKRKTEKEKVHVQKVYRKLNVHRCDVFLVGSALV